ncbi:transglycosylase SLT domain-containing protein [Myxococcus sp. K15C18031901]|uniref:lytic transglycosylase domain-containing protein n=1 Tax=Myxococcus dinghuensis TaxID=2906761 RepID=UPI0020A791E2|nr:transglycosylase SLT domain-containing protein [Myxococcus dinghuensis]MCP3097664.1 transglycosylase SLT domain-containing protein [Myxococcus dinghuensis]
MSLSPLSSATRSAARPATSSPSLQATQQKTALQSPTQASAGRRPSALQQDGFDAGGSRAANLGKLLEGTLSVMNTLVQMMSQLAANGGAQGASGAPLGSAASPSSFGSSGFSPCASGSKPPVELNPGASAAAPVAGPSAAPVSSAVAAPVSSPGVTSTSSPSITGDAKLGGNLPPGLEKYRGAIESAAAKAGVPASMIAAQIWQESRGDLSAATTNGGNGLTDTGLMQVNPNTFKELQAKHPELQGKDLSDPATNILAGACYMKDMKEQFGSWDLALRAYNSGPNGVDRGNPDAIPAGTGDATYVQKVKSFANTLATGQGTLPA